MLLVIPSIDLCKDHCVRELEKSFERESVYFDDPVKMARLWRLQNARALHIAGHDPGNRCRRSVLRDICEAVDIPVQLRGGLTTITRIKSAFAAGVYRIIIEVTDEKSGDFFLQAAAEYSMNRVIAGIHSDSRIDERSENTLDATTASRLAKNLESAGCRRFVFSDESFGASATENTTECILQFCSQLSTSRVTVVKCISNFQDLRRIMDLAEFGVDSAIIGRALYENQFPCQQSWCWNHKEDLDLSTVSTARLKNS